MENKIIEFLANLNKDNSFYNLYYYNNGFTEGVYLPKIELFNDNDDSKEYLEQLVLSRLVKKLSVLLEGAETELLERIDSFLIKEKKIITEYFPNAKVKRFNSDVLNHYLFLSGKYDEDKMHEHLENIKSNFEVLFEGIKLNIDC